MLTVVKKCRGYVWGEVFGFYREGYYNVRTIENSQQKQLPYTDIYHQASQNYSVTVRFAEEICYNPGLAI